MKKLFVLVAALAFVTTGTLSAAETWKGTIGDSMCALKHSADKDKQERKAADLRACVEKCVQGGGEYVLIAGGKAHKIANQKFAGLKTHAGQEVTLTGEMKDDKITVTKIEMPKADTKK